MRRYHLPEVLVLLLGLLLSLWLAWAGHQWETEERALRTREHMAVYVQAVAQQLESLAAAVQSLAQFYNHSDTVQPQEFALFARPFLERNPAIQALEWVPLVRATDRAAFEDRVRAEGADDFAIREQLGADLPPAAPRPDYFPVWRVVPLTGNARALGFDLGSEPRRRAALEQARDTGQATATVPLTLVQETANQRGILIFVPVGRAGVLGATVQERRQRLRGFALGVMRIGMLMEQTLAALPPLGLDLVLRDATLPGPAGLLHPYPSRTRGPAMALDEAAWVDDADGQEARLTVAGRTLVLRATPAPGAYPTSGWPWLVLGLGLVISAALFALLRYRRHALARLREREALFSQFMDHSPTIAWIKDAQGRWVYLSAPFERGFGMRLADLRGKTDEEVWPPDLAAQFVAEDQAVLAQGQPLSVDSAVPFTDGQVHDWRVTKFPFQDADGRRFVGGIGLDVTAYKQMESALRISEERLRVALDAARMGVYDWDTVADRMVWSSQLGRLWGFESGEFDGTYAIFTSSVHPDDCIALHAELARCMAEGTRYSYEFRIVWPDWSMHWVVIRGEFVCDAAGRSVRMTGVAMEITERKCAEEELLAGGARLEAALASMTDAVSIADTQGCFSHLNAAFAAFHRFSDAAACPKTFAEYPAVLEVVTADGKPIPVEQWAVPRALRGETAIDAEYTLRRKDTRETWVGRYSFAPIRNPGGVIVGSVVTARDITGRKQAQLQLRRFQQIVETSRTMFTFVDCDLCYQVANPAYAALYQTTPQLLHGRRVSAVVGPEAYARIGPELRAALAGEPRRFSFQRTFPDGRHRHLEADYSPFRVAGVVQGVVASLHDVTATEEARAALQVQQTHLEQALRQAQLARVDALTGIANRAGFDERLQQAFALARRHGRRFGLIFLDLDGFKAINDTRGHLVGDQVLKDVAASLVTNCRTEDLAGRYGGDEFALVLSELLDGAAALVVAERVRDGIAALNWDGCRVSGSLGVALYPDHADDLLELVRLADHAMYASKAAGKNRVTLAGAPPPALA